MLVNGYFCGALTANLIYLGENMGLYKALAEAGPCTSDDLASKLKLAPRYVAEWCRQQAAAKIITCDEEAHTFWLTDPQKDVLVHEYGEKASPFYAVGKR